MGEGAGGRTEGWRGRRKEGENSCRGRKGMGERVQEEKERSRRRREGKREKRGREKGAEGGR